MATQSLYYSTVDDRVEKIKGKYGNDAHEAFLRLIFYLVTGFGYDDLEEEEIIDGQGEYQIDVLHIDTTKGENYAVVTLLQVTTSDSLSFNKLIKMHTGLDYLLRQPKAVYSKLSNKNLRDKIIEFRGVRDEILPSNIKLQCYYAYLGDPSVAQGEVLEQINRIETDYRDSVGDFSFKVLGPEQIFGLMNLRERKGVKTDDRLKIIYDQNKGSLLEHAIEVVSGVICTADAEEIARIVNKHPSIFDDNLRRFLGFGRQVNNAIQESCTSQDDASLFWFLNNGITIVCDYFEVNRDVDNPFVEINNIRIVNGCQTSTTLAKAKEQNQLQPSTKVMVKIFRTKSSHLASKLVITTNTQNKITSRDLHAQDPIQDHLQQEFDRRFGIKYERTPNEFVGSAFSDSIEIISNQKMGQSVLAVVRKFPGDANSRQYKIWGDQYAYIFTPKVYPEALLLSYRIVEYCVREKRLRSRTLEGTERIIVTNGVYHLGRAISFLWRDGDKWDDLSRLRTQLTELNSKPDLLAPHFDNALKIISNIFEQDERYIQNPITALKSGKFEDDLDTALYSTKAKSRKKTKK